MKKLLLSMAVLLLISTAYGQSKKKSPLYGTWILESAVFTTEDSVTKQDKSMRKEMKILSPGHFIFIITDAADDKFIMASGGRTRITNDTYTEIIDYSSRSDALNKTYNFSYKIVGDTWYHNGEIGNWKLEEVWKRAK